MTKQISKGVSTTLNNNLPSIADIAINRYEGLFGVMLKSKSFGGILIGISQFTLPTKMSWYKRNKKTRENKGIEMYQIILISTPKKEISFLFIISATLHQM